jgi:hypothetical protein
MDMMKKATESQLTFLRNSGASFKVILANGEVIVHDPQGLIEPKKKSKHTVKEFRNPGIKHGEPSAYVAPFLESLEPGQMVEIPCKYHPDTMRSVACNYSRVHYGSGNYMTEFNDDKSKIHVLRIN